MISAKIKMRQQGQRLHEYATQPLSQPFPWERNPKARHLSPALKCISQILKEGFCMLHRIGLLLVLLPSACVLPSSAQTLVTTIPVSGQPNGISVNPTTNRIYVTLGTAVDVIDGSTNTVVDTVQTPQGASFIAANIVTGRVYTAGCSSTGTCGVTVIDGATNAVVATIPLIVRSGIVVQGIAVNPLTNRVYVADDFVYRIAEIDGNTNTVLTYIKTGNSEALGLAVDFATGQILAVPSGGALLVINGSNNAVSPVKVGFLNWDVAANSFTNRAYVTNNGGTTLGVVDLVSLKQIANVTIGSVPLGVCVDYLSNKIFVTVMAGDGRVAEVDGTTNAVTGTLTLNSDYIDVNPVTRLVYATDTNGSSVNVISE
jgi:YVTN family beta-propeller protein